MTPSAFIAKQIKQVVCEPIMPVEPLGQACGAAPMGTPNPVLTVQEAACSYFDAFLALAYTPYPWPANFNA